MGHEPEIIVQHREQLAELLTEAVEVEHNLMCCYLYAAWSLKAGVDDGLTAPQASSVADWRRTIVAVAVDEMTHFANANNLLSAIGGRPHFGRPNFPVSPGYHPAEVQVALHRFDWSTIDHFVYLERPEGLELPDGADFPRGRGYVRATTPTALMPSAQDFETVGGLYRGIRDGFESLAGRLGEDALFAGDPDAQITPVQVSLDGLVAVRDLGDALQAIDSIVAQGEGNVDDPEHSHYRKFCRVRDELAEHVAADPGFDPARPVARNPVQRRPPIPEGKTWVGAANAARVLDFANAVYNHMLRTIGTAYEPLPAKTRAALVDEAIGLMGVLVPTNAVLTSLPTGADGSGPNAGMSFAITRAVRVPPAASAVPVLSERTRALAEGARQLADVAPVLAALGEPLDATAARIAALDA